MNSWIESFRREDGTIDLVGAWKYGNGIGISDYGLEKPLEYLKNIESVHRISSRQVLAVALANADLLYDEI